MARRVKGPPFLPQQILNFVARVHTWASVSRAPYSACVMVVKPTSEMELSRAHSKFSDKRREVQWWPVSMGMCNVYAALSGKNSQLTSCCGVQIKQCTLDFVPCHRNICVFHRTDQRRQIIQAYESVGAGLTSFYCAMICSCTHSQCCATSLSFNNVCSQRVACAHHVGNASMKKIITADFCFVDVVCDPWGLSVMIPTVSGKNLCICCKFVHLPCAF